MTDSIKILLIVISLANPIHNQLVSLHYFDEAQKLAPLCIFSADFFFYRAITQFKIKQYKECLRTIDDLLLLNPPERYREVALRIKDEIERDKNKYDDIATDMQIAQERLELGKGGPKTQKIQQDIIKKLDEEIKKMEEQIAQQQQQQVKGKSGTIPLDDTKIIEAPIPEGKVDNKKIVAGGNWGNMPPKQKIKVTEEIGRVLPSHIKEAAENFSRKLLNPIDSNKK